MYTAVLQQLRCNPEMWLTEAVQRRMLANIDTGTYCALTVKEERKTDWQPRTAMNKPTNPVQSTIWTALEEECLTAARYILQQLSNAISRPSSLPTSTLKAFEVIDKNKHCECTVTNILYYSRIKSVPSVLWCCWLGSRKEILPVKNWVTGANIT